MKRRILNAIASSLGIALLLLFSGGPLRAQDYPDSSEAQSSGYQGRVVRLSLVEGDVSIQRSVNDQWMDATINAPVLPGYRVWVGAQGRTEIEFDDGSFVRLASNSVLEFQQLDVNSNGRYSQVFLSQGLAYFNIRENYSDTFRVTTPSLAADAVRAAQFRLSVDGQNDLTVFRGEVNVNSSAGDVAVHENELFSLYGDNSGRYDLGSARGNDDWDRWNFDRDQYLARATSYRYVPSSVSYGVYDLDRYGRWAYEDGYGYVWAPDNIAPDWVPYSYGRWALYPDMGYTWVSYEPWGWLPYHYGGWAWIPGFGWGWAPGISFAYWSPARVFFFHHGGYVGWCPFSPFDTFYGGGAFININAYRPRNFAENRFVVVNNNTFVNHVVTREAITRNHEVLQQMTTSRDLQFRAQPQIQRAANSEALRPASFGSRSNAQLASDTKGWSRTDGIRGTGARPSESLQTRQPFASPSTVGAGNREGLRAPASRSPTTSSPNVSKGRSDGRSPAPYSPPATGNSRTEGLRQQVPSNNAQPRVQPYQAPARQEAPRQDSRQSYTPPPARSDDRAKEAPRQERQSSPPPAQQRRQEQPKQEERSKTPPPQSSMNYRGNYAPPTSNRTSYYSDRSSYVPPAQTQRATSSYTAPQRAYTPPSSPRSDMRSSYVAPQRSYSPPANYSAPAPRYVAPRQTYSPPATSRESFARSTYSAPSYSRSTPAPASSFHSAPSRPSGGGGHAQSSSSVSRHR
jgi:hypothetical protein